MVIRTRKDAALQHDKPYLQDDPALVRQSLSSARSRSKENIHHDDLIVSLGDAHENKRARQVTEWERRQVVKAY
jgi:hypothetical protein